MEKPQSHRETVARLHADYEAGVADGSIVPFVYPIASIGAGVGLLFYLIPPSSPLHNRFTRYATFAFILCWHVYIVLHCKGLNPSTSFGIGVVASFGTMWSSVLLVFCDPKSTFRRIQVAEHPAELDVKTNPSQGSHSSHNGYDPNDVLESEHIEHRNLKTNRKPVLGISEKSLATPHHVEYYWQPYPTTPFKDRIWWILDLWTNFRLIGWNHKVSAMPSYPIEVEKQLNTCVKTDAKPRDVPRTKAGLRRYDSSRPLVLHNIWLFIKGYIILDIVSTLAHHDPYFTGKVDAPPPSSLPAFMKDSPYFWVKAYRLTAGMLIIWLALRTILVLAPLCFVGIVPRGLLGSWKEPWLYPDHYGSYMIVLEKGLSGWWGGWWHQSFRGVFQMVSAWILNSMGLDSRSLVGRSVTLFTSFLLSGLIHASGSKTQLGKTQPLRGSMLFFLLQPFGILTEALFRRFMSKLHLAEHLPTWATYVSNFLWVHFWFWLTAALIVDDLARGGLWLTELVAFSPTRALGLGTQGDGFFCWHGPVARLHISDNWIMNGISF